MPPPPTMTMIVAGAAAVANATRGMKWGGGRRRGRIMVDSIDWKEGRRGSGGEGRKLIVRGVQMPHLARFRQVILC